MNGGTAVNGEGWGQTLQRESTNRYTAAAFCSWWATGGSIPHVLPRRLDQELNLAGSLRNTGNARSCFALFISSFGPLLQYAEYGFSRCSASSQYRRLGTVESIPLRQGSEGPTVLCCGLRMRIEALW